MALPRRLNIMPMLNFQHFVHLLFREAGLLEKLPIRGRTFAKATALDENLRLEKALGMASFALDVVDGAAELDVGIEPEDHDDAPRAPFRAREKVASHPSAAVVTGPL
jgi:hypothetical protein